MCVCVCMCVCVSVCVSVCESECGTPTCNGGQIHTCTALAGMQDGKGNRK